MDTNQTVKAVPNSWWRNRETREIVKISKVGRAFIEYSNSSVSGEIRADKLSEEFEPLGDPGTREEIEALLGAMYDNDEADTGLYKAGIRFVVMDNVDGTLTFTWFDSVKDFEDMLPVTH